MQPESSADAHSGHIQYMSSIVREHRQKLRRKYGVQFILDALRTHYRCGWHSQMVLGLEEVVGRPAE